MPTDEFHNDITEKIKIFVKDDEKIKSFGEVFVNYSSRDILRLLSNLSTAQITQKRLFHPTCENHPNKFQSLIKYLDGFISIMN